MANEINTSITTKENATPAEQGETKQETPTEKTFTQKEIDAIITERLSKERKKFEKEKSEVERLATMSAEEKEREKFKKEKEEFELEKKTIKLERMQIQVSKELEAINISGDLAKFIIDEDADVVKENIKSLKEAWEKSLEIAVNNKISGNTPKGSNVPVTSEEEKLKEKIFKSAGLKI